MEVIILAGGFGSRLQSVVSDVPKCMAEVAGKPFLSYLFEFLIPFHPEKVILSLGYMHEIIEEWVNGCDLPFEIVNKVEYLPLGTGGAVKYALSAVTGQTAVIINGDTFFDLDLKQLQAFHQLHEREATLALKLLKDFDRYGSVLLNKETAEIIRFEEKKYCKEGLINGGVYILNKNVLDDFPEKFSLESDYFVKKVLEKQLTGYVSDGYFIDIGIPEDYKTVQQVFAGWK